MNTEEKESTFLLEYLAKSKIRMTSPPITEGIIKLKNVPTKKKLYNFFKGMFISKGATRIFHL